MIAYLIGTSIVKSISPYCRKHVINSLDTHEFMLLNTFLISFILLIYLIYSILTNKIDHSLLIDKYYNLSHTQIVAVISFSVLTVLATYLTINIDKNYGNIFSNGLMIKAFTTIIVLAVGIYIFEETYTYFNILGIILLIIGIFLLIK